MKGMGLPCSVCLSLVSGVTCFLGGRLHKRRPYFLRRPPPAREGGCIALCSWRLLLPGSYCDTSVLTRFPVSPFCGTLAAAWRFANVCFLSTPHPAHACGPGTPAARQEVEVSANRANRKLPLVALPHRHVVAPLATQTQSDGHNPGGLRLVTQPFSLGARRESCSTSYRTPHACFHDAKSVLGQSSRVQTNGAI